MSLSREEAFKNFCINMGMAASETDSKSSTDEQEFGINSRGSVLPA